MRANQIGIYYLPFCHFFGSADAKLKLMKYCHICITALRFVGIPAMEVLVYMNGRSLIFKWYSSIE